MGGKALNFETERKTTEQFNRIFSEIEPILKELGIDYFLTKCYRNKETHGDMDILIKDENLNKKSLSDLIKKTFNPNSINPNDKCISFDYDKFQIDFILIKKDSWDIAKDWYSYDCYGNCAGKIAHRWGLKYGPNGLIFPFRGINDLMIKDILISTDSKKTFEFFGYDYNIFQSGFDTLEEIFDFIVSSKYFNYKIFKFENLNAIDKKRNKKRKSYNEFLKYIENIKKEFIFNNKESYINDINEYFPESKLIEQIELLKENDRINNIIKNKFNGDIIMKIYPDLKGKELGYNIKTFKEKFSNFNEFVMSNTIEEILNNFDNHLKNK